MKEDFIDELRIASPCEVGWENMSGTERMRFCTQCDLHVYNIAELTRVEVASLITKSEGRVCARLYRRSDGTVITQDCPVGLRDLRRRIARRAGAALAAVLSLTAGIAGQSRSQEKKSCKNIQTIKVERKASPDHQRLITGVVLDPNGAVIPRVKITLIDELTEEKFTTSTTDNGEFHFAGLNNRDYTLDVEAPYFKRSKVTHLRIDAGQAVSVEMFLEAMTESVTVGILMAEPSFEFSNGTTIIRSEMINRLPLPR